MIRRPPRSTQSRSSAASDVYKRQVQNPAARLVTGARQCDHITPVLRQLHWLSVRQRVVFKIAGLVHQSLVGLAPAYLADNCRLLSDIGRHPLRSNSYDMRKLLAHKQNWWWEFLGHWSSTVERPSTWTPVAGTCLRLFQTIFENSFIWRPQHLVTLLNL